MADALAAEMPVDTLPVTVRPDPNDPNLRISNTVATKMQIRTSGS